MRTVDGRLALITLILAILAVTVFLVKPTHSLPDDAGADHVRKPPEVVQDLQGGMRHDDFIRVYGKARRVERRPDGLLRLYYDQVTVTFDALGRPIEILAQ